MPQHFLDCGVEGVYFACGNIAGRDAGVDAGMPESFARVDVADASNAALIHDDGLDGGFDGVED